MAFRKLEIPEGLNPKRDSYAVNMDSIFANSFAETRQDVGQFFGSLGETVGRAYEGAKSVVQDKDFTGPQKVMGVMGQVAGGVSGVVGDLVMGAGKIGLSQEAEDSFKAKLTSIGQGVAKSDVAKSVVDWYGNLSKEDKLFVDSVGGVAAFIADVYAPGTAKTITQKGAKTISEGVDAVMDATRPARIASQEQKVNEAVGRILQGTPDDVAAGKRALTELDTKGVETYADLNARIDERIGGLSKKVDEELSKDTNLYKSTDLAKVTEVGGEVVAQSPVRDALAGLRKAYLLSNDPVNAKRIEQLTSRMNTSGLTLKEVNDIAREYGTAFKDKAFDKMGNPKAGFGAEGFENVRSGVKDVLRSKMSGEATKALDSQISDLYSTKNLTTKMEVKVNQLFQRLKNRTLGQKVGGALADVFDMLTLGSARGFVQKLIPSNVGLKTANSLDLERELAKNLAQIEKLLEIKNEKTFADEVAKYLREAQPGMSIRPTEPSFNQGEIPLTTVTPKSTGAVDNLMKEAKKYKSAEEFVRSQPVVYHGSPVPLKRFSNKKGGVFFTEEYADATGFAGSPDNVYEGYLNFKKPLEIDAKGAKWDEIDSKWGNSTVEINSKAQEDGYDGVIFRNIIDNIADDAEAGIPGNIYYAMKPEDAFVNESQLIDIWKKANGQ